MASRFGLSGGGGSRRGAQGGLRWASVGLWSEVGKGGGADAERGSCAAGWRLCLLAVASTCGGLLF